MKYSHQRELVRKVVGELFHPTAEEIFEAAKKYYSHIGIATVYRNLNILASAGLIMRIAIPDKMDKFDSVTDEHYHAVCDSCGKIIDIYPPQPSVYNKILVDKYGFTPSSRLLIIHGICSDCASKNKEANNLSGK